MGFYIFLHAIYKYDKMISSRNFERGIAMPYVNIKITKEGNVTPEQKRQLIEGATDLLHNVLGKNKATTVVVIDEVDTDNWGIGGIPVTEIRKNKK